MFARVAFVTCLVLAFMVAGCGGEKTREAKETDETEEAVVKMTDPVCGMYVDAQQDLSAEHEGKTYYFCSTSCKERFETHPERYIRR